MLITQLGVNGMKWFWFSGVVLILDQGSKRIADSCWIRTTPSAASLHALRRPIIGRGLQLSEQFGNAGFVGLARWAITCRGLAI
jgi:hypothetical protein